MRKAIATIAYVFCGLPMALSALLLLAARPWALDRDFYRRVVSDDRLYRAVAAASADPRGEGARLEGAETVEIEGSVYDAKALAQAVGKSLPVDELKAASLRAVDEALNLVEGSDRDGSFDLDLRPLKAAIRERAPAMARDYVAALPARPGSPATGDFSYRPASLSPEAAEKRVAAAASERANALPDSISSPVDARIELNGVRTFLSATALDRAAATLATASGLLLAALAALGGSGIAGRIAKAGRYLLPPSILVLALGALMSLPGSPALLAALPAEAKALMSAPAAAAMRDYVASVLGQVARSFFVTGLVGASLGGVLASARRIAQPKEIE